MPGPQLEKPLYAGHQAGVLQRHYCQGCKFLGGWLACSLFENSTVSQPGFRFPCLPLSYCSSPSFSAGEAQSYSSPPPSQEKEFFPHSVPLNLHRIPQRKQGVYKERDILFWSSDLESISYHVKRYPYLPTNLLPQVKKKSRIFKYLFCL